MSTSRTYVEGLKHVLESFPHAAFNAFVEVLQNTLKHRRRVYVMGNGGSAANASHWVCDMNKGCGYEPGERFGVICLNDNVPTLMAYANDLSYDDIFVEQLKNFLAPEDVVIGISGSGNSKNVLKAMEYANRVEAYTVALVGFDGGKLSGLAQLLLHIPCDDMQMVEDMHSMTLHMTMKHFSGRAERLARAYTVGS